MMIVYRDVDKVAIFRFGRVSGSKAVSNFSTDALILLWCLGTTNTQ
jgi:hypothetical protein